MLSKIRLMLTAMLMLIAVGLNAQVTTSSMGGKVTDSSNEPIIGAAIRVVHQPSGTRYNAITNVDGRYSIQGMRAGGPYKVDISYVGFQSAVFIGINLSLGENYTLNANMKESNELLDEVVITAAKSSNMKSDRAGAITNIDSKAMAAIPTVSRSLNDVMRLSPQSNTTSNGFAVGGGNYRQSYITVDGAAFNNSFGIGSNLPAGGSPISIDALEQMTVSVTPYDVRQSGFTGGSINAVTKSGTNQFKGSAYSYITNNHLMGSKVGDSDLSLDKSHDVTYGASLGGAIIKDKLFFFVNGEYEDLLSAGPVARARVSESTPISSIDHRPTVAKMDEIRNYLIKTYNYDPGAYQDYNASSPSYKFLARIDWNINDKNKLNFRFSKTKNKYSSAPSTSTSPWAANDIFPGNSSISQGQGASSNYGLFFKNSRYYQEQNFSSIASEWTSKWGKVNNALRFTYSFQDEPRSYDGGAFPTTYILQDGAAYAMFGTELFTEGNIRQVKTFVVTDEASWSLGNHNLMAGMQFESNSAVNGYAQGANGAYVFSSWDDFVSGNKPSAFLITHANSADLSQFQSKMKQMQYSAYFQDQWNVSDNFKLNTGIRLELPVYPSFDNNYNEAYAKLRFAGKSFSTDQLPKNSVTVSPRVGFNWDLTGERKYVVRGGTGYFVGRMPFVWLVSAVGNSNVGQIQYSFDPKHPATGVIPSFHANRSDILKDLYPNNFDPKTPVAPSSPTILDRDLKMPATWKTSLAFDAKLPGDVDFTLEGIYNKDFGPAVISNPNYYASATQQVSTNDYRAKYSSYNSQNAYLIENGDNRGYYYSITAQLHKAFDFGLDLSFAYTHSKARSYGDGIGDQVTSAYKTNTYSINGINDHELGYGTYVAPHRILASVGYSIAYAKMFKSSFSFLYEGVPMGYAGGPYSYSRYSYTYSSNIVGDGGANNLMYIPASKDELTFADVTAKVNGVTTVTYSAADQKNDFWSYVMQDKYLRNHLGQYAERGGVVMPWHHQLDFKFNQDINLMVAGKKNTLQFGVDIQNLANLLNKDWGLYKQVNTTAPLKYNGNGTYTMLKVNNEVLKNTYTNYNATASTYRVMFSVRYIFN